ncbi:hypothetical protein [Listeria newyorkensis]|uniref:hypothetical protein n=1 Tax=Listeria newyorkensis TaxID=1497681 RepID=UPI00051D5C17|nr:hypothetical protein [Listeria newyorkensis]KGL44487.1 hypothetical protein EP56_07760 [Listeriaceae bacterium FSL A5-0209]KGL45686.1 hypothetical protein EP58_03060 [Listeria newyorkensis]SQC55384.1 Uncharacterised protein [Listeria newyorkensis]
MEFIDSEYFLAEYVGVEISAEELQRLIPRASRDIDRFTRYAISRTGFDNLVEFQRDRVMEATAAQVEFLFLNGETASVVDSGAGSSVRIGNYSEGGGSGGNASNSGKVVLFANNIYEILAPTGLLYAGVPSLARGCDCC